MNELIVVRDVCYAKHRKDDIGLEIRISVLGNDTVAYWIGARTAVKLANELLKACDKIRGLERLAD